VAGLFLLLVLRPYWGVLYTSDGDVQAMVYKTLPIMLLYITVDSTKCITLNILRSTGRPGITVVGNVFACLAVMLPLGYYLGIKLGLGLVGLWGAMSIAWLLATFVYFYVVVTTGWQEQCCEAMERNKHAALNSGGVDIAENDEEMEMEMEMEMGEMDVKMGEMKE
jgi:Na+-driven multidrug efflux pump